MMPLRPYMLLLILICFALAPMHVDAAGAVNGSILYGTGQYSADVDGKEVYQATSQYGQVALDYQLKNMKARLGKYTLLLGYEFNILDPSFSRNGIDDPAAERIETGKFLYQGEILVAPGGLPFRFSAYARDINRSLFTPGGNLPSLPVGLQGAGQRQNQTTLLSPDIMTEISNGTHHEVGATLLIGIRNGSYLGNYRNILSQLPRLLIDYKQSDVRDLAHDANRQHYRERDLAFISLNKKDNWVHFRTHDYTDYLDATKNFTTQQVMIGTVDQMLTRQWINLTNWIKISGDLSYTVEKENSEKFPNNAYSVNLFAHIQRQEFMTNVLSSFERTTKGERLTQDLDLPVYFNYEPNRDSFYRGSLRSNFTRQTSVDGLASTTDVWENSRRDVTFDLGSELFRTRDVVFKPRLMLGVREDDNSQGVSEKVVLEWSNQRGKSSLPWTAGYYLASTQTSSDSSNSSLYLEQSLYGSVEKRLKRAMRVGGHATIRHGNGQSENSLTESVSDRLELGSTGSSAVSKAEVKRFLFYEGLVFWEHAGESFSNRLEFMAEGIKTDVDTMTSTEVRHLLQMSRRLSKFSLSSTLSRGSNVVLQAINTEYRIEPGSTATSGADFGWSSEAVYSYAPDRRLLFSLLGRVKGLSGAGEENTVWLGSEKLEYRFYNRYGLIRKIAEISEELGAEGGSSDGFFERDSTIFLRVAAALYPTKHLYARVASELAVFNPVGAEQVKLNAETGANFEKMQVALSYGRGYKSAEGLLAEVKEERWDVKVKKTF